MSRPMQESLHPSHHGCQSRCCSPKQDVMAHLGTCSPCLVGARTMPAAQVAGTEWLLSMMSLNSVNTSQTSFSMGNLGQHSFRSLVPSIRTGVVSSAVEQEEQVYTSGWKNLHILLESLSYMKWNRNKAARGKWAASLKDKVLSLLEERLQLPLSHSCQSRFKQPC